MELQIRNDFDQALLHVDEWRDLVLSTPGQPFFMLPEYQTTWWKHLGHGDLEVLEFYKDKKLVGLLPLYKDTIKTTKGSKNVYRIVGAMDESDYLDIIFKPKHKAKIFSLLLDYLTRNQWDEVWLECLNHKSVTFAELQHLVTVQNWTMTEKLQTVAPVISLPKTFDAYLKALAPRHQKAFKNLQFDIGVDDDISYRLITAAAQMPKAMKTFIRLHKASGTDKASFWNPQREAFFIEVMTNLAKQDLVKLYFLDVNGESAACMILFDWRHQFLGYNSGFDAYTYGYLGVSNALVLHTIQEAITLGRNRYDFMRGDEEYKFSFGAVSEAVNDIKISRE